MSLFKECHHCPRRTIEPSCKNTCPDYAEASEKNENMKKERRKEMQVEQFEGQRGDRTKRYCKEQYRQRRRST